MLTSDPDYYYSPESVTQAVAEIIARTRPTSALDSNCGEGALLDAVERGFAGARCVGIDIDNDAIRHLRKTRPHWTLVEGDALSARPWQQLAKRLPHRVDIAVLNPPFSMGSSKGIAVRLPEMDSDVRCSLAMAHVLTALHHSRPAQVLAILPESLVCSQLDGKARSLISSSYKVEVVRAFKSSTFRGTRANSVLVAMAAGKARVRQDLDISHEGLVKGLDIVRGGLPNFQAKTARDGMHYIHTTALAPLANGEPADALPRVSPRGRGRVEGHVLLLPRVGLPKAQHIRPLYFEDPVQLSDCVIALTCGSERQAQRIQQHLDNQFVALKALYAGTGARYITVERLFAWLRDTLVSRDGRESQTEPE